ncbi:MAG: protease inhibitor I9 family protein, partial [Nocardioidaceae bacterium]
MRKLSAVAATAALLTAVGATSAQAGSAEAQSAGIADADSPDRIAGQYIVTLEDSTALSQAVTTHRRTFDAAVGHVYDSALKGYSATMSRAAAQRLAQAPGVQSVQANTRVEATAQSTPTGINRANADASPTANIDGGDQRV